MTRNLVAILCMLAVSFASAESTEMNPIRKIVTLMQDMQKEIEAEGEKEKELYDKFMCFCDTGAADLLKAANDAEAQNAAATSKLEAQTSEKAQLEADIK